MTTKAYVLLSGGLDSSTLLGLAVQEFGRANVVALSIDYGQRHKTRELSFAQRVAEFFEVNDFLRYDLRSTIGQGGLTDPSQEIPDASYDQLQGISPTYVPFRNGLMLSTITSIVAEVVQQQYKNTKDEFLVGYGAHAEDAANWAYPDCTPEFIGAMANAIYVGTYHRVRLWTPLMHMKKYQIVNLGISLDPDPVPYHLTWSCYKGEIDHCGTCPTCRARKEAFDRAGVIDPTVYQVNA